MPSAIIYDSTHEQRKIAEALRNLQQVVSQCQDAVFITDASGVLLRVNPAFEKLTGYSSLEAVGKDFSTMVAGGADANSYSQIWEAAFQQRTYNGLVELVQRDRTFRRVSVTITPVRDSRGHVTSLVGTGRGLEATNAELASEHDPGLTRISALGHELNNALMLARSRAEIVLSAMPADHPQYGYLREVSTAARRAASLAHDLRETTRERSQSQCSCGLQPEAIEKLPELTEMLAPDMPAMQVIAEPLARMADGPANSDRTLLIVEDEALIRESTVEFLSRVGYKVLSATSGEDALQKLKGHAGRIDLVITDVVLPEMSGVRLAEQVTSACPQSKVLFISGYAPTAVLHEGNRSARQQFLQKPFSLRALADKIEQTLKPVERARAAASPS